mgnify:CR=1 FL=1
MSAKKSRKDNIPVPATQPSAPAEHTEKTPVSAAPRQGCCMDSAFTRKDALMVVLYSVLLLLAMTVQTGTVSMILCALAFLSLLGKKPLSRFERRLSVPVLGLLAFAIVYGASAIYSPFGASTQSEFYKFIAAFSLAVILLSRFERKHVPGLLWGGASVSTVIALVSLDMSCARVLFGPFNALMNALGTDYTSALQESAAARVNGLYNDANVTAALFSLAIFAALYLLQNSTCIWRRLAASLLAGVNAVSLLLTGSRGALLCFAAACIVWLIAERADRVGLFLLLVETAVTMIAAGVPASSMASRGNETAVALCLFSGLILFALDALAGRRLGAVLSAHKKAAMAAVGALCAVTAALCAAVFLHTGPYTFEEDDSYIVYVLPDGITGDATITGDVDGDPRIEVYSQSRLEGIYGARTMLYDGPFSQCAFTVPENSGNLYAAITGQAGETLRSVAVSGGKKITLNYPWLPEAISSRLLSDSLLESKSFTLRAEYDKDAWKIFSTAPILGRGLGSTENVTRSVQSFQYESKYAHNHLLQTMADTGLVGTVFALAFVLGSAWLCLRAVRKEKDSLAAALLAVWVMMNLHSLMEINFSVRGFKCFAYVLLALPVLLYAKPLLAGDTAKARKQAKTVGILVVVLYALYLAVFGGLLESARMTDRKAERFETSDVYEYLNFLRGCVRGDVFDHDSYQRNYVANAVQLNDRAYNGDLVKYVKQLRASGTYENDSALARYYYLPRQEWDELFDCSLEGIRQVRSSPDGWNLQMDFYREEVLPAMGADNAGAFMDGVLSLGEALDAMNAEGRLETVELNETNQSFLTLCRSVKEQGISGQDAYTVLSLMARSGEGEAEDVAQ